jgi:hypothetical protein
MRGVRTTSPPGTPPGKQFQPVVHGWGGWRLGCFILFAGSEWVLQAELLVPGQGCAEPAPAPGLQEGKSPRLPYPDLSEGFASRSFPPLHRRDIDLAMLPSFLSPSPPVQLPKLGKVSGTLSQAGSGCPGHLRPGHLQEKNLGGATVWLQMFVMTAWLPLEGSFPSPSLNVALDHPTLSVGSPGW